MLNLNTISKEHELLLKLEGKEFDGLKAVACIHLGKFKEALKYAQKGSFEAAYVYYKLKNFKKALKIISKFSDNKSFVLKSQILYSMGYYNNAYVTLKQMPKDDEIVINLQAMKSMAILTAKVNKSCGHKLWMKKRDNPVNFDNLDGFKFSNDEGRVEFYYNKTFENADTAENYLKALENVKNHLKTTPMSIISKQINNIEGYFDEIDLDKLSKTQKEIVLYNMNKQNKIENSLHYLKNFSGKLSESEYNWFQEARSKNFDLNPFSIPSTTDNLKLLRIFIGLRNKSMSKNTALKEAGNLLEENYKEIVKKCFSTDVKSEIEPGVANMTI